MNKDIWKWINRIFASGIWLQPFSMAALILFFKRGLDGDTSYLILFALSFLPSVYVWSENQRQAASGKKDFSIEDIFHDRPTEYSSPLKMQAMYPQADPRLLYDTPQGIVLGRTETGRLKKQTAYLCNPIKAGICRNSHVLVIGGSGSGKSSAIIIPSLLSTLDTGMFCVDIKGELWSKSRRMDDPDVVIVNFQDRSRFGWDFLYQLNHKKQITDQDIRECMEDIANSLIPIPAKENSKFWKQSARSLLCGELTGLYKQKGIHNLSELINEILSRDTKELVAELIDHAAPKAIEIKLLSSFKNLADETLSGVVQEEQENLKAFTDEDIRYAAEVNPRQANPLMLEEKKAVFLAIPEEKLEPYYNVINLIISQVFSALIRRPEGSLPVMVVIDEFARLVSRGPLPYLHNGLLLTGRSRNITLILVTQSLAALETAYSKADILSVVANCAYIAALDIRDQTTAKTIAELAGTYKERETTWSGSGKNRSISITYRDKNILEPSDLSHLVQMDEVVLISSEFNYCRVKKCSYFNDPILGPQSDRIQRYNREALGIEGREQPMPVKIPTDNTNPYLRFAETLAEKYSRMAKEKTQSIWQNLKGDINNEKRRYRKNHKRNTKKNARLRGEGRDHK